MKNVRFGSLCRGNKLLTYSKMNFGDATSKYYRNLVDHP